MRPTLGMAEATVFVVTSARRPATDDGAFRHREAGGRACRVCAAEGGSELVTAGTPRTCELRVVDPETRWRMPAGEVGELWMRGDQVGRGTGAIRSRPSARSTVSWRAEGTPRRPWLKTGDLAVMFDGELFIIGRIKDLLIVDGRNHYPDDIEVTVGEIIGGRVAAVSIRTPPARSSWSIAEVKASDPEQPRIPQPQTAVDRGGLEASMASGSADLVFVGPGSLPITTSGKVRVGRGAVPVGQFRAWMTL